MYNYTFREGRESTKHFHPCTALHVIANICLLPPIITFECLTLRQTVEFGGTTAILTDL